MLASSIAMATLLKFAANNRDQGTADENKETVQGSLGYSGTYSVSDQTLILTVMLRPVRIRMLRGLNRNDRLL
jgi:hypothetical protein